MISCAFEWTTRRTEKARASRTGLTMSFHRLDRMDSQLNCRLGARCPSRMADVQELRELFVEEESLEDWFPEVTRLSKALKTTSEEVGKIAQKVRDTTTSSELYCFLPLKIDRSPRRTKRACKEKEGSFRHTGLLLSLSGTSCRAS